MMNFNEITKRINEVCGLNTNRELAKLFGITEQNLSNKKKKGTILQSIINEALKIHPEVNLHWLLTGEGEKYIQLNVPKSTQQPKCIYSRASDKENRTGDMLANFSDKKMARECLDKLLEIDRIEPDRLKRVENYLRGLLDGLRPQKKTANNS